MAQILDKQKQYSKYYGDFLGVDFSDAQTQVNDRRLAYLCNMWKDYHNGQGKGIETIPGFREAMMLNGSGSLNGIHEYVYRLNGVETHDVLVHRGTNIYLWKNFPASMNVEETRAVTLGAPIYVGNVKTFHITLENCYSCSEVRCTYDVEQEIEGQESVLQHTAIFTQWVNQNRSIVNGVYVLSFDLPASELEEGFAAMCDTVRYDNRVIGHAANNKSISFVFNNVFYLLDGTSFFRYDGTTFESINRDNSYVPTIYINTPAGVDAEPGTEYKQRNMLNPFFKQTFVADGETKDFRLAVDNLEYIGNIRVYGQQYTHGAGFSQYGESQFETQLFNIYGADYTAYEGNYHFERRDADGWYISKPDEDDFEEIGPVTTAALLSDWGFVVMDSSLTGNRGVTSVNMEYWEYGEEGFSSGVSVLGNHSTYTFSYRGGNENNMLYFRDQELYSLAEFATFGLTIDYSQFSTTDTDPTNILHLDYDRGTKEFEVEVSYVNQELVYDIRSGITYDLKTGLVHFDVAPTKPEETVLEVNGDDVRYYTEGYAGIEIMGAKAITAIPGLVDETIEPGNIISHCTIVAAYDDRIFLSGNPRYPNAVFWCGRNVETGFNDPTYWGIEDFVTDGVESVPIMAMIPVADTLAVLKGNTRQDGSVFYHTPLVTETDLVPVTYPHKQGLAGTGCLGAAINFRDDPVFVSEAGLSAIGQLSVRLERALEHRSSLVDTKLTNEDLANAELHVWDGYLVLSVGGKFYLADSRQPYSNAQGVMEYEWYYLEDIGDYAGQYEEYRFMDRLQYNEHLDTAEDKTVTWCSNCHKDAAKCECATPNHITLELQAATKVYDPGLYEYKDLSGTTVNPPNEDGTESTAIAYIADTMTSVYDVFGIPHIKPVYYAVKEVLEPTYSEEDTPSVSGYEAYLIEKTGAMIGGVFYPAKNVNSINGMLTFGTDTGKVFVFNTDKRNADGSLDAQWYTFNGRTIVCGCATKLDNCDIPHLTKTTIRKSIVIKTRNYDASAAKIKVRTNNDVFTQIARINSMQLDFAKLDFRDFSFSAADKDLFAIKEKEKKWVEKQYFIYSDEIRKPFALYYLAYRYYIHGRYKNR